eukprot:GEZU01037423.1.p2 GENE.GEZU01037423.1~~GEZU01037423.1.p2  ORF type:complete len:102 (-),score=4.24 GEZU01037423.1:58-363(-)
MNWYHHATGHWMYDVFSPSDNPRYNWLAYILVAGITIAFSCWTLTWSIRAGGIRIPRARQDRRQKLERVELEQAPPARKWHPRSQSTAEAGSALDGNKQCR